MTNARSPSSFDDSAVRWELDLTLGAMASPVPMLQMSFPSRFHPPPHAPDRCQLPVSAWTRSSTSIHAIIISHSNCLLTRSALYRRSRRFRMFTHVYDTRASLNVISRLTRLLTAMNVFCLRNAPVFSHSFHPYDRRNNGYLLHESNFSTLLL